MWPLARIALFGAALLVVACSPGTVRAPGAGDTPAPTEAQAPGKCGYCFESDYFDSKSSMPPLHPCDSPADCVGKIAHDGTAAGPNCETWGPTGLDGGWYFGGYCGMCFNDHSEYTGAGCGTSLDDCPHGFACYDASCDKSGCVPTSKAWE